MATLPGSSRPNLVPKEEENEEDPATDVFASEYKDLLRDKLSRFVTLSKTIHVAALFIPRDNLRRFLHGNDEDDASKATAVRNFTFAQIWDVVEKTAASEKFRKINFFSAKMDLAKVILAQQQESGDGRGDTFWWEFQLKGYDSFRGGKNGHEEICRRLLECLLESASRRVSVNFEPKEVDPITERLFIRVVVVSRAEFEGRLLEVPPTFLVYYPGHSRFYCDQEYPDPVVLKAFVQSLECRCYSSTRSSGPNLERLRIDGEKQKKKTSEITTAAATTVVPPISVSQSYPFPQQQQQSQQSETGGANNPQSISKLSNSTQSAARGSNADLNGRTHQPREAAAAREIIQQQTESANEETRPPEGDEEQMLLEEEEDEKDEEEAESEMEEKENVVENDEGEDRIESEEMENKMEGEEEQQESIADDDDEEEEEEKEGQENANEKKKDKDYEEEEEEPEPNVLMHECKICNFKSKYKSHLKIHVDGVHLKLKKYVCRYRRCDYKFTTNYYLQAHINGVHKNVKKHECDRCDYKTNYSVNLRKHMNGLHTNPKAFVCEYCDFKTGYSHCLKVHIGRKHPGKLVKKKRKRSGAVATESVAAGKTIPTESGSKGKKRSEAEYKDNVPKRKSERRMASEKKN